MTDRAELEAWLQGGAGEGERAREVHETPIAKVFVFQERVLKLKKPVNFGFLDFTSCEKRAWATRRELVFNRQTAPDVYRAVHAVVRTPSGVLVLADPDAPGGDPIDHVLEMRPFETNHILANDPGQVDATLAERLGREIAQVQSRAKKTSDRGGAAALDYVLNSNAEQLHGLAERLGRDKVEALLGKSRAVFERLALLLDARRDAGFVRRCHGDLHLGNIVVEDGRPILFDCIEFNDVLSEIDVGYDVAFLLMDLGFRGRAAAANRVLNAWLDEDGRGSGPERMAVLAALPLFQAVRAAVRAHVSAHAGDIETARRYLDAGLEHFAVPPPRLVAVGGLSGSGKSTLARSLGWRMAAPPGAVVLRSDEVRKRLFGVAPTARLPKSAYAPEVSSRVYDVLLEDGRAALGAGASVVLDAAFLKPDERARAASLAQACGVAWLGCWMEAPEAVLRERLRARRGDASDADEAVLDTQLQTDPGEIDWRRIDATDDDEGQVSSALG